jgi:RimJ/RimL family protein N-acetyltransferase
VIVRPATEDDLETAVDVLVAVAAEGRWIAAEPPVDRAERLERWRRIFMEEHGGTMFVADVDDTVVGFAAVKGVAGPCGTGVMDLGGMAIASDHRGKGIGSALVQACIDWARESGAHKIALQVWPHNEAARSLYRKFGFEEEGYLRRHWRRRSGELWDAVVMGLLLDEAPTPDNPVRMGGK